MSLSESTNFWSKNEIVLANLDITDDMKGFVLDWTANFFVFRPGERANFLLDLLTYLLLGMKSGYSLRLSLSSSSVDIVVNAVCSVYCRRTYGLTKQDQINLSSWFLCNTAVSPYLWMNLGSPSHLFGFVQKTITEVSGWILRTSDECSMPFGRFQSRKSNAIFLRDCSFATSSMTISIYFADLV